MHCSLLKGGAGDLWNFHFFHFTDWCFVRHVFQPSTWLERISNHFSIITPHNFYPSITTSMSVICGVPVVSLLHNSQRQSSSQSETWQRWKIIDFLCCSFLSDDCSVLSLHLASSHWNRVLWNLNFISFLIKWSEGTWIFMEEKLALLCVGVFKGFLLWVFTFCVFFMIIFCDEVLFFCGICIFFGFLWWCFGF